MQDTGTIPGSGRSPGGGHGNPLQYSCLKNLMDRGAWWATVQCHTKSDMTEATEHTCMQYLGKETVGQGCGRTGWNKRRSWIVMQAPPKVSAIWIVKARGNVGHQSIVITNYSDNGFVIHRKENELQKTQDHNTFTGRKKYSSHHQICN